MRWAARSSPSAGLGAAWLWVQRRGWAVALGLGALYVGAFVLAHVLAIGAGFPAWLAVSLVTLTAAGVTFGVADASRATPPRAERLPWEGRRAGGRYTR